MPDYQAKMSQGGSIASFLLVGIVLVALLGGGIFILQKRDEKVVVKAPVPTTSKQPVKSTPSPSLTPVKSSTTPVPAPVKPTETIKATPSVNPSLIPSKSPTPSPKPSTTPIVKAQTPPTKPAPLPTTGPSDYMPGGLVLATFVGVFVAYIQSRRLRSELSL